MITPRSTHKFDSFFLPLNQSSSEPCCYSRFLRLLLVYRYVWYEYEVCVQVKSERYNMSVAVPFHGSVFVHLGILNRWVLQQLEESLIGYR